VLAALPAGSARIGVEVDPERCLYGTFAQLQDPEGNALQPWQPAGADLEGGA
jgi:glyoxylase I family protein